VNETKSKTDRQTDNQLFIDDFEGTIRYTQQDADLHFLLLIEDISPSQQQPLKATVC